MWLCSGGSFVASAEPAATQQHDRRVWVAEASDAEHTLLGFVDCEVAPAQQEVGRRSLGRPQIRHPRRGKIRWLWYEPGAGRAVG
eukprot:SAG31_NODE_10189_length_1173_cov_0.773743_1_plen_84_part_10